MINNLKWYFGQSAAEKHGPNDSITTTFKGDKYYSLAREVLQNSIDAVDDKTQPVKVTFSYFELEKLELESFWSLRNNLEACQTYFASHENFKRFCELGKSEFDNGKIKCLKISDFNTSGLEYSDGTDSKFFGFMESVGVTNKSDSGSGGSFGFGKGAYYAASTIRTIVVSSIYGNGDQIFQGKARLTTHKDDKGDLKDYTGLFGLENGKPVTDSEIIPTIFKREKKGTDIIIMGFHDTEDWRKSLVKSVLNNFWLAIWEEKLIVDIEGTVINKDMLELVISNVYNEDSLDGSVNEPETWNPYPYFKAVKFAGDINTKVFEKKLEILGEVKLYLYLKDGLPNRIIYLRSPKMVVFKKTDNRGFNYAGVFVCDNKDGNEILRQMENPQHNEWKKNNYLESDKPHLKAKKAEIELKEFIKECLETLMTTESNKPQNITGLDEYLNIPEDLIPEKDGSGEASGGGNTSDETTTEETAVEITKKENESPITLAIKKKINIPVDDKGKVGEGGEPIFIGRNGGGDDIPTPPVPGTDKKKGNNDGENNIRKPIELKYRVIAQKNSANEIEHILKIFSNKKAVAEFELFAGVDNDSEGNDGMLSIVSALIETSVLASEGNKIKNILLENGFNTIRVKFDSNQKHSLKIKSYEI